VPDHTRIEHCRPRKTRSGRFRRSARGAPRSAPLPIPRRYRASTVPKVKAEDLTATSTMRNQRISSESAQKPESA
jgi:hypothetical protein